MIANQMGNDLQILLEAGGLTNKALNSREKAFFLNSAVTEFINTRLFPNRNTKGEGFEDSPKRILDLSSLLATGTGIYLKTRTSIIDGNQYGDFVRGTRVNGAMRNNDKDEEVVGTDGDDAKHGVLVELLDEVLFIVSKNCDISTTANGITYTRHNVPVENLKNEEYNDLIYNSYRTPYTDMVWLREQGRSLPTSAGLKNTVEFRSSANSRLIPSNIPISTNYNFDGINGRVLQLIPPKDYEIDKFNIYYIKQPKPIVIDLTSPQNQVNCELHPSVHLEIVQIAARIATAALLPVQQKYQVTQLEAKANE